MKKFIELTGMRFERLLVLERVENDKHGNAMWLCKCDCNNIIKVTTNDLRNGHTKSCGCFGKNIAKQNNLKNRVWLFEIGTVICNDKQDITIIEQCHNTRKKYRFKCNKCNWSDGIISETDLLKGRGCACCSGRVVNIGINDITTKAPWMIEYIVGGIDIAKQYTPQSNKIIEMICPSCKRTKLRSLNKLYNRGLGCTCGDGFSYPEKFMDNVLQQLNANYEWGFSPKWLVGESGSQRKFDFMLYCEKIIIETDGRWHSNDNKMSGQTALESKAIDNWKDEQARLNGYTVYRINAYKSEMTYLKEQITKTIGHIIDLSNIDWLKCDKAGTRNIVKKVAEYYMDNKLHSLFQISKVFNLHEETIRRYLKKAKLHNWCDYDVTCNKKVHVFKDNKYLGTYSSQGELARKSIEDFGVKFHQDCISCVVRGKQKQHKGYIFKNAA